MKIPKGIGNFKPDKTGSENISSIIMLIYSFSPVERGARVCMTCQQW
ncbi:MAG: hypothetical protein ACPK85_01035 [Methanosarcina sp.]